MLMLLQCTAMATTLESLMVRDSGGKLSITCKFNGPFTHKAFMLQNPERFVLDLKQTTTTLDFKNILTTRDLIKNLRSGHPYPDTLRLVFDARDGVRLKVIPWQRMSPNQRILRIDVVQQNAAMRPAPVSKPPVWSAPAPVSARKAPAKSLPAQSLPAREVYTSPPPPAPAPIHSSSAPPKSMRDVVVVIDPGHGGKDPGAIGTRRSAEKHVVLAIALKLKQLIDRQPGMRAVLTRNGDYYVGLRQRMEIARRHNADIFVAIHADAFNNHQSSGASVFALSQRGATSEAARWLAEKENHSELGGVNLSGLDDRNGVIRTVLLDLSQTATIGASLQMGRHVLRDLDSVTSLHNKRVEQARFVVLKSPDIPSILVETGFISNLREEKNLNNPIYQSRLAQAIFQGVKGYFWDYPPHGTRIEAMAGGYIHLVRAGERLQAIAERYHVSVAQLRKVNHLIGTSLRPGQKLNIPASWA